MRTSKSPCFIVVTSALLALAGCSADDGRPSSGTGGETSSTDPSADTATASSSDKKANAEPCAEPAECESGVCFVGGNQSFCSARCTPETAATVCVAPFTGSCNKQGYCKRD